MTNGLDAYVSPSPWHRRLGRPPPSPVLAAACPDEVRCRKRAARAAQDQTATVFADVTTPTREGVDGVRSSSAAYPSERIADMMLMVVGGGMESAR